MLTLLLASTFTAFSILQPKGRASADLQTAADEIRLHFNLLGLAEAAPDRANAAATAVRVHLAPPPEAQPPDGRTSYYRAEGDDLWLWGGAEGDYPGVSYAAYTFLKEVVGFIWAYPGEAGIVTPAKKGLARPVARREGAFTPALQLGRMRLPNWNSFFQSRLPITPGIDPVPPALRWTEPEAKSRIAEIARWYRRQRNLPEQVIKYGHAFVKWQDRFAKTHPEYFSLDERGRRIHPGYAYRETLCVSNPDVVDQIVADWKAEGCGKYLNVCENDGSGFCRCPNCRALDADLPGEDFLVTKTDRYLNFYNRVAAKARQIRPDVMCAAYIYSFYRFLPRRERIAWPDNMVFGFVPSILDDYRKMVDEWRTVGMRHFFLRPNFHTDYGMFPRGIESRVWEIQEYCRTHGMIGVDYDAYPGRFPLNPESYVAVRTISEGGVSFERLMDEYCSAYGEAADAVKAYYGRIRARGTQAREEMARVNLKLLDDSQLVAHQLRLHSEAALTEDLQLLRAAAAKGVSSAAARRRLDNLLVWAESYLHAYRFMMSVGKADEMRRFGRALISFRLAHRDVLRDYYANIMNSRYKGTEGHVWKLCPGVLREFGGWTETGSKKEIND